MKTKNTRKLSERKTIRHWKTKVFGFPVVIDAVEAFRFEDEWVPDNDLPVRKRIAPGANLGPSSNRYFPHSFVRLKTFASNLW